MNEILVWIAVLHIFFPHAAIITCWYNISFTVTVVLNSLDENLAVNRLQFIGSHHATQ